MSPAHLKPVPVDDKYIDALVEHVAAAMALPDPEVAPFSLEQDCPEIFAKLRAIDREIAGLAALAPDFARLREINDQIAEIDGQLATIDNQLARLDSLSELVGFPEGEDALDEDEITYTNPVLPAYLSEPDPDEVNVDERVPEGSILWFDWDEHPFGSTGVVCLDRVIADLEVDPASWTGLTLVELRILRSQGMPIYFTDEIEAHMRYHDGRGKTYRVCFESEWSCNAWLVPTATTEEGGTSP